MRNIIVLGAFLSSCVLAQAGTMEVQPDAPVAKFTIPDAWQTSRIERGIQAISKDGEVDFWIEAYKPSEFKQILAEHDAYWKDQGVVISSRDSETHKENGQTLIITNDHATWNGKPTVLYYVEFQLGLPSKSNIVFTYWASPAGDQTFHKEVGAVLRSLTVTEK
ncbi:MAG: hypothetical protein JO107_02980 [Hyphomicrobiales bacterium]|nr:hypothetical protein [Hyphomicrobiales bacterium]